MASVIPLAKGPLTSSAELHLTDAGLELSIPAFFGGRRLVVPGGQVEFALVDSRDDFLPSDDVVFRKRLDVPFLWTRQARTFNLVLLFTQPQRLPRARLMWRGSSSLPFDAKETRSAKGCWVDGVCLEVADPPQAYGALVSHLATHADSPRGWFESRREVVTDPAERLAVIQGRRRLRSATWVGLGLVLLSMLALLVAGVTEGAVQTAAIYACFAALGGSWLLGRVLRRTAERAERSREPGRMGP